MACQFCRLCEAGFPVKDGYHVPTQALGMIPATRCTAIPPIPRGSVKRFREHLNAQHTGPNHRHHRFHQRTRKYGDYLYAQDRDKFMVDMCDWLTAQA